MKKKSNIYTLYSKESYSDITVIVLNTSLYDYQIAYYINKLLNVRLCRKDNILFDKNYYPYYLYFTDKNNTIFSLMSMTSYDDKTKIPLKLPFDFLFVIKNIDYLNIDYILKVLREIPQVTFVYKLDNKDTLTLELLNNIELKECFIMSGKKYGDDKIEIDYDDEDNYNDDEDNDDLFKFIVVKKQ